MEILSLFIEIVYFLILVVVFILGLIVLINYFTKDKKSFNTSAYTDWLNNAGALVADMNDCAEDLKKLDDPNLNFALGYMNDAINCVLSACEEVAEINNPLDDMESKHENT